MKQNKYTYQIIIIGILFAVFGFVTWVNSILIPFLKKSCELTDQQAFYVTTAFFAAYFFLSLPSSWILNKLGTKKGMTVGLTIMATGCLVFVSAAGDRSYPIFLLGLFIVGMGLALLQTAANPYVSLLGDIDAAAKRISIMGICNKLAGIFANFLFGSILLKNATQVQEALDNATNDAERSQLLDNLASRVEVPYISLAVFLIIIAVVIYKSSLPDITEQISESDATSTYLSEGKTSIFQFPHVFLGALAIFFYVGAEVMAADLITIYGQNLGFSEDQSKFFAVFGLVGLLVGYGVNILIIPKYVKQEQWLIISCVLGVLLTALSYFTSGSVAVGCLAALGFANAVMWPAIFPLGIRDIGPFSNLGSAILIMGIVGGAVIPPLYGWLYEKAILGLDFKSAFVVVMVVCYGYIFWFAKTGYQMGFPKK